MAEYQIEYNLKTTLSAPDGGVLKSITVSVDIEPKDSGCLIYGWLSNGKLDCIEVLGGKTRVELPFCKPEVFVKYLPGLKTITILTHGWRDALR